MAAVVDIGGVGGGVAVEMVGLVVVGGGGGAVVEEVGEAVEEEEEEGPD